MGDPSLDAERFESTEDEVLGSEVRQNALVSDNHFSFDVTCSVTVIMAGLDLLLVYHGHRFGNLPLTTSLISIRKQKRGMWRWEQRFRHIHTQNSQLWERRNIGEKEVEGGSLCISPKRKKKSKGFPTVESPQSAPVGVVGKFALAFICPSHSYSLGTTCAFQQRTCSVFILFFFFLLLLLLLWVFDLQKPVYIADDRKQRQDKVNEGREDKGFLETTKFSTY